MDTNESSVDDNLIKIEGLASSESTSSGGSIPSSKSYVKSSYPRLCACGKTYGFKQSYFKHVKTCTGEKLGSIYPRKCDKCDDVLGNKVKYFRHKRKCNGGKAGSKNITYPRECETCHNKFKNRLSFSRHRKIQCSEGFVPRTAKPSPCIHVGCTETFYHRTAMIGHLTKDHMKEFQITQLSFPNMSEFRAWKDNIERESYTSFRAPCGVKGGNSAGAVKYHYFTCVFDAHVRNTDKDSKNKWKWKKGCIPTELLCPARMLVSENETRQVQVKFIETHNHPLSYDLTILHRVPLTTRHFIQTCLLTGMKADQIISLLRSEIGELSGMGDSVEPKKDYFISLQYVNHIKSKIKAECKLDSDDHTSVDLHLRNLMHIGRFEVEDVRNSDYDGFDDGLFSPVLVYKPQGKPVVIGDKGFDSLKHCHELFIAGFQTKEQLEAMKDGCKIVLCIDSTHSTTENGFFLVNMFVPDEYGEGYPVAHFITSHRDSETMQLAFQSIKTRCPDLEINLLMTDDDQAEYEAFLSVFPGPRHVLCTWHVRRNWNSRMKSIGNADIRRTVSYSLAVLMYEKHEPTFKKLLEGFISDCRVKCPEFIGYFETHYVNRPSVWALCYRNFPHGNTYSNICCESLHNKLKTYYMERPQNKRVDNLIQILLRTGKDYFIKSWKNRAENKTKVKVTETQKRTHIKGFSINDGNVIKTKENFWVVKSQQKNNDEEYFVLKYQTKCSMDHCFVQCVKQVCKGLCEHLYSCTCSYPGGMCKHIHKVHSLFLRDTSTSDYEDRVEEFIKQDENENVSLNEDRVEELMEQGENENVSLNDDRVEEFMDLCKNENVSLNEDRVEEFMEQGENENETLNKDMAEEMWEQCENGNLILNKDTIKKLWVQCENGNVILIIPVGVDEETTAHSGEITEITVETEDNLITKSEEVEITADSEENLIAESEEVEITADSEENLIAESEVEITADGEEYFIAESEEVEITADDEKNFIAESSEVEITADGEENFIAESEEVEITADGEENFIAESEEVEIAADSEGNLIAESEEVVITDSEEKLIAECEELFQALRDRICQPGNSQSLQHIRNQLQQLAVLTNKTHQHTADLSEQV